MARRDVAARNNRVGAGAPPDDKAAHTKGRLGPFLCWAIVFADLGTSVYYTPGILFQQPGVGPHAALFVGLTLVVFVLLARKYGEVAVRYPEGGGVVTVTANAIHPFAGVLGGMFILVDYFLTAAPSALSGIIYLSDVFPALHPVAVYLPVTIAAIVLLGVITTALVALAWTTNLVAKPLATLFGGGVTVVGLLIAFATYTLGRRGGRPFVFPLLHRENYPVMFLLHGRRARPPATVLAILPRQVSEIDELVLAASRAAADGPIVFVRRGTSDPLNRPPRLFEIVNPYLDDPEAQEAFAQAERLARRRHLNHRYLYLPSTAGPDAVARFWETLRPEETLVVAGEEDVLAGIPAERVYASDEGGVRVLHYQTRVAA